ncbi:OmpL47-type beta-barrel domain-containing protein [Bacteroidota bacterium]
MSKNSMLISLLLIIFTLHGIAQDKILVKSGTYMKEDGKFYIQKKLPAYIYISNSPDSNSVKHRLRSKTSEQYTNPMHFDADGFNSLRTHWAVNQKTKKKENPPQEIIFEVYADSKPPETYGLFDNKTIGYNEGKRIYPVGTALTLLEYDAVSGTSKIYYSINQNAFIEYKEKLVFNEAKIVNIQFYGIDHVGNTQEIHQLNFIIQ